MVNFNAASPSRLRLATWVGSVSCRSDATSLTFVKFRPFDGGEELRLGVPDFHEVEYNLSTVMHLSRGNKIHVYTRGEMTKTLPLVFTGVSRLLFKQTESWVEQMRGRVLTYTDEWGDSFTCAITRFSVAEEAPSQPSYRMSLTLVTENV